MLFLSDGKFLQNSSIIRVIFLLMAIFRLRVTTKLVISFLNNLSPSVICNSFNIPPKIPSSLQLPRLWTPASNKTPSF